MGLISILSDLGSIGSTTRWAIESYQKIKENNKGISDKEIYEVMMIARYNKIKLSLDGNYFPGRYDRNKFMVYWARFAGGNGGLSFIITEILNVEADLWRNQKMMKLLDPLVERMADTDFSKETKYGCWPILLKAGTDGNFINELEWMKFITDGHIRRIKSYMDNDLSINEIAYENSLEVFNKYK